MLFNSRSSLPVLGRIPNVEGSGLPLLRAKDAGGTYAEAFRSLHASLAVTPLVRPVLVVTSALPGEGKSTVASNLAITMALDGKRGVLIDADLRRGNLGDLFGVDSEPGLSNVLRGEMTWPDALEPTGYENLSLLARGPACNESGELLRLPVFGEILGEIREKFDFAVLNTSPILATEETQLIGPHCDGALLVVRQSSGRGTFEALKELRGIRVLGSVLNCPERVT